MAHSFKEQVLSRLIEQKDFISGEQLKQELGVSRTCIWKSINKLKDEGYQIESITNKGYRLVENPEQLVESLLFHDVNLRGFEEVVLLNTVDSTNTEAKRRSIEIKGNGLYVAKEQTQGKGRRGRIWQSQKDTGLYMSLLLRPRIEPQIASMATLLAGLAVCKSIEALYGIETRIKWPNDLVHNKKKLCGILTEMSSEVDYINYVIIGIGLNLFQTSFPEEVASMATSLHEANPEKINVKSLDIHKLILSIVDYVQDYLIQLEHHKTIDFVRAEYEHYCINILGELKIELNGTTFECIGKGISKLGHLNVMLADGTMMEVNAGEVSVRGIYGYV